MVACSFFLLNEIGIAVEIRDGEGDGYRVDEFHFLSMVVPYRVKPFMKLFR